MAKMTDIEKLREIALDQHGLVTAAQAEDVNVSRPSLSYLVKNERIERIDRGIYRIPQVQYSPYDVLQQALLWAGEGAVLSHDTALAAWDVCDINPTAIYITVPKTRRIQKITQQNIVIHREDIPNASVRWWEGMPTVSVQLALKQCIDRGVSSHIIDQAIRDGLSKGMIRKEDAKLLSERLETRNVAY